MHARGATTGARAHLSRLVLLGVLLAPGLGGAAAPRPPLEIELHLDGDRLEWALQAHAEVRVESIAWRALPAGALPAGLPGPVVLAAGERRTGTAPVAPGGDLWIEARARGVAAGGPLVVGTATRRGAGAPPGRAERLALAAAAPGPRRPTGDARLRGRFLYEDRLVDAGGFTGAVQVLPLRHVEVVVRSAADTTVVLARGHLDGEGRFDLPAPPVEAGDLYVDLRSTTRGHPHYALAVLEPASVAPSAADAAVPHVLRSPRLVPTADGLDLGTTRVRDVDGYGRLQAFHILDNAIDVWDALARPEMLGRAPEPGDSLRIYWGPGLRLRATGYADGAIQLVSPGSGDTDGWSDAVILHEIGHHVAQRFLRDDNPGGVHLLGDVEQPLRLAWSEGLASAFACWVRAWRAAERRNQAAQAMDGGVALFVNTGLPPPDGVAGGVQYVWDVETHTLGGLGLERAGLGSETNLAGTLWDLLDDEATPDGWGGDDEATSAGEARLWGVLRAMRDRPDAERATFEDFWRTWKATAPDGTDAALREVLHQGRIELEPDAAEPDEAPYDAPELVASRSAEAAGDVLLSEIVLGSRIAVEIVNRGTTPRDLTGWQLVARSNGSTTNPGLTYTLPRLWLGPQARVVVRRGGRTQDATVRDVFATQWTTSWFPGVDGAVMLLDRDGQGIDFVRWNSRDGTPCTVAPPAGTGWSGDLAAAPFGAALARLDTAPDRDTAGDFEARAPSLGAPNSTGAVHRTFFPEHDVDRVRGRAVHDGAYTVQVRRLRDGARPQLEVRIAGSATPIGRAASGDAGLVEPRVTVYLRAGQQLEARVAHTGTLTRHGTYELALYAEPDARQALPPSGLQVQVEAGEGSRAVHLAWWNAALYDSLRLERRGAAPVSLPGDAQAWSGEWPAGRHDVQLWAHARDESVASAPLVVAVEAWPDALDEAFESLAGEVWQVDGSWGLAAAPGRDGLALCDSPDGPYGTDAEGGARLRAAVLGQESTSLCFDHICIVRPEDEARLEASADWGATWQTLGRWDWDAQRGAAGQPNWRDGQAAAHDWVHECVSLESLAGNPLQVRFTLRSDRFAEADGWWIDALRLAGPEAAGRAPLVLRLAANAPNPFNPTTRLRFEVSRAADVQLAVYDVRGRLVRRLLAAPVAAGPHELEWDGRDDAGHELAAGVYLLTAASGAQRQARKLVLVR